MILSSGRPIDRSKDIAILLAAREILLKDGPGARTMEAVASKASVSKATLYTQPASGDSGAMVGRDAGL